MNRTVFALLGAGALLIACGPAAALDYTLDPNHTQVRFSWSHFGFSVPEANFNQVTGTLIADENAPEKAQLDVSIPVNSIDTHVAALNEHLLEKPEFFKAKQYPTITFKSTGVQNVSSDKKTFEVVGDLTVNGITKQEVLHARLNKLGAHPMYGGAPAAGFIATTTLKRSDFGMGEYVPNVSDELQVRITAEAIEAQAFAKKMEEMKAKQP